MCGQDRNILEAFQLFLNEIIPFPNPLFFLCHKKSVKTVLFSFIHSPQHHRSGYFHQWLFHYSFFCTLIYATGTNVSVPFFKMIKQADTPRQFIRQVLITSSKSRCHPGFTTSRHYQLAVGVSKMIKSVEQVL